MDTIEVWMLITGAVLWVLAFLAFCNYFYDRGLREGIEAGRHRGWEEAYTANRFKYVDTWSRKGHPSHPDKEETGQG